MKVVSPDSTPTAAARWSWWVLLIFSIQVIFFLWIQRDPPADSLEAEPGVELANAVANGWMQTGGHEDPELLSRPNAQGFSAMWMDPKTSTHEPTYWQPPLIRPPLPSNYFAGPILAALKTNNAPAESEIFRKPGPTLTQVSVPPLELRTQHWLEVTGALQERLPLGPMQLPPSWDHADVIPPTVVEVLVDEFGIVQTGVLIESSGFGPADQAAMTTALQRIKFQRSTNQAARVPMVAGSVIFHWHVNPNSVTNLTERPR